MNKCPKTVSGKHIWSSEVVSYTLISKDELQPNTMLKCRACGLYDDVNVPTETQQSLDKGGTNER